MTDTPIPDDVMQAARELAMNASAVRQNGGFVFEAADPIARVLMDERSRQEERVRVLEEALRPFAKCADEIDYDDREREVPTSDEEWAKFRLLVGDYRRARAALGNGGGDAR